MFGDQWCAELNHRTDVETKFLKWILDNQDTLEFDSEKKTYSIDERY
jgi:hypothetical protein